MQKETFYARGQHTHEIYFKSDNKADLFRKLHEKYPSEIESGRFERIYPEPLKVYKVSADE